MKQLIEPVVSEIEDEQSDAAAYKVISFPADYTLKGLHDKWAAKEIVIPPFQRQYVWSQQQASRLIESFLLGLPVPGIFFYKDPKTQKLIVIDGQQRLRSVFAFFEGHFESEKPFFMKGVRPQWDGKSFTELSEPEQIKLRDAVLRAMIIEQTDPKDHSSMSHIFERLNTGGVSLKPQEIRNCIFQGPLNDLLKQLNGISYWRTIIGQPKPDARMRDIELIARFLALFDDHKNYKKPMKDYISDFMLSYQNAEEKQLKKFSDVFSNTADRVIKGLGPKPFHIKAGLNAAVYDSVMVALALSPNFTPDNLKARFEKLISNKAFEEYVTSHTTDQDTVRQRIRLAQDTLVK